MSLRGSGLQKSLLTSAELQERMQELNSSWQGREECFSVHPFHRTGGFHNCFCFIFSDDAVLNMSHSERGSGARVYENDVENRGLTG